MAIFQEKRYDGSNDRLFLVYYALDDSLNLNGWRVSPESLDRNIRSFIGKPAVLKQKDQNNALDRPQVGKFVHPVLHNASLEENLNYQEQFTVGRINNVSRNDKGWRFDVEITDPDMKEVLKSDAFVDKYPRWVSPQIATFPEAFPDEDDTNVQHWTGLHLAFVDMPAFGFNKSDMAGKCYGSEQVCKVQLRSAASSNNNDISFCIKSATTQIINSSQKFNSTQGSHMSDSTGSQPSVTIQGVNQTAQGYTVLADGSLVPNTMGKPEEQPSAPGSQAAEVQQPGTQEQQQEAPPAQNQQNTELPEASLPRTLDEAYQRISAQDHLIRELQRTTKMFERYKADNDRERGIFKAMLMVPRELFRTQQQFDEECEKVWNMYISKGIPDEEVRSIYRNKLIAKTLSSNTSNNNNNASGGHGGGCSCGGNSAVSTKSAGVSLKTSSSVKPWTLDLDDMLLEKGVL